MRALRSIASRQALYAAVSTLALQATAIVVLVPSEYGLFSLYYLTFALGSSVVYSAVSEAWARSARRDHALYSWPQYCTALVAVSGLMIVPVLGIGLITGTIGLALLFAGAVALATYRVGARFYSVARSHFNRVGVADLAGAAAFVGGFFSLNAALPALDSVAIAWLISTAVSVLFSERPRFDFETGVTGWVRGNKSSIRVLLIDSTLMDLSTIGVPLLLAPLLGITNFGIYRGVSSAALPVRLVLNPIRPLLGKRGIGFFARARVLGVAAATGMGVGLAIFLTLILIRAQAWFSTSVVFELADFALPVGIFVASNFIGMLYYLICRSHLPGGQLLLYRVVQMAGSILLPVGGFLAADLPGAIWGVATNSVVNAVFVVGLVLVSARIQRPGSLTHQTRKK